MFLEKLTRIILNLKSKKGLEIIFNAIIDNLNWINYFMEIDNDVYIW